jgi:2-oxoglutarate ferredoxin oxidoreductase subunit alpha
MAAPTDAQDVKPATPLARATVRLAGDSGDGMQLVGSQLTTTSALAGNDVATFPDYPAEIRAPRGTRAGVSGFQIQFAAEEIFTPGDRLDALVAMNPAALVTNLGDLDPGGMLIVNQDSFEAKDLQLANLTTNPLEDGSVSQYHLVGVSMTKLTRKAVEDVKAPSGDRLPAKIADRCRNFFAMGLVYWLYGRDVEPTLRFIRSKFARNPEIAEANEKALHAGWNYGETAELMPTSYNVGPARLAPGTYRNLMGSQALAWGLMAAAEVSGKEIFYASYPITPASAVLEELSRWKRFGVRTFQAEDEIAAMSAIIGSAFGGALSVTASSGPGIALKGEAMGLAMILELPLLIVNVQRGGPSTGLPTKTEQSDLLQAFFGRNGESPLPILAARSPADCFDVAGEAWRIATRFMVPVILLLDGSIVNGAEPWRIPQVASLPRIPIAHPGPIASGETFQPYARDERLSRPWALPGTPGLMHRLGGLEKQEVTGHVSYDPENHHRMTETRARKVEGIAGDIPRQEVVGPERGELLVLSWGGTFGACATAVEQCRGEGLAVAHAHLRYLNPMPRNLGEILQRYRRVLIPELNMGQLRWLVRAKYLVDAVGHNKVTGRPFAVGEIVERIRTLMDAA